MVDEDTPLSVLAAAPRLPARKVDDDTPLSVLALGSTAKNGTVAKKGIDAVVAAPPKKPGAKASAAGKKRPRRESPTSSSSSYSSDSDSDDRGLLPARSRKAVSKSEKLKMLKKRATEDMLWEEDAPYKKKDRSNKENLVASLLCRWWYCDEYINNDWPPQEEEYYQAELRRQKLRKVTIQEWEWLPEEDEQGRRKVYELSEFRGLFRNSSGDLIDLRPKETCPCYNNFMKKDNATLCRMLISAYKNQLKDLLENCRYRTDKLAKDLKASITKVKHMLQEAEKAPK
mmetsp:Transcript_44543/g.111912  ORF Transcript_44543/g.111912 Transcript_44543/m.111912 type:complete len:286 (-) Transcript_44543:55-912(-)